MTFLSWERGDVIGSKLVYRCKSGSRALTWSGRGVGESAWRGICLQPCGLCFSGDLRGLPGRAETRLAQNPEQAGRGNENKGRSVLCQWYRSIRPSWNKNLPWTLFSGCLWVFFFFSLPDRLGIREVCPTFSRSGSDFIFLRNSRVWGWHFNVSTLSAIVLDIDLGINLFGKLHYSSTS